MDTDVLIVGAGPTGLMLANQLGRRGVRTLIIDRHDGPALQTRALGVQARTKAAGQAWHIASFIQHTKPDPRFPTKPDPRFPRFPPI
jgi:2-polyprenyl-6-methoxyphenol hydroxylase-like FAD-dependent oxidoreductase